MKKALNGLLALVSTVALAGCPATGFFAKQTTPQSTSLQKGSLSIKIQWPEKAGQYRIQNLPYRASIVDLSVKDASGSTVLDLDGNPCVATVQRSGINSETNLVLNPQKDLMITAIAYEDATKSIRVGEGTRSVDILPDFQNNVDVEIIADDAPVIQGIYPATSDINPNPAPTTALNFDTPYTVKGANFGATKNYSCQAGLVLHRSNGGYCRYPFTTTRISDSELQITIPSGIGNEDFRDNYLLDSTGKSTLSFDVTVDGASAPLQPTFTLPKTGTVTAAIGLHNGTNATASTGYAEQFNIQSIRDFGMPNSSGSTWVYSDITDGATISFQIHDNVYPPLEEKNPYSSYFSLDPANYNNPDFPFFLQIYGEGQLQNLGTESIVVGQTTYSATHYYCPVVIGPYQATYSGVNAWYATGVGLVKYKLPTGLTYLLTSFVKP